MAQMWYLMPPQPASPTFPPYQRCPQQWLSLGLAVTKASRRPPAQPVRLQGSPRTCVPGESQGTWALRRGLEKVLGSLDGDRDPVSVRKNNQVPGA